MKEIKAKLERMSWSGQASKNWKVRRPVTIVISDADFTQNWTIHCCRHAKLKTTNVIGGGEGRQGKERGGGGGGRKKKGSE